MQDQEKRFRALEEQLDSLQQQVTALQAFLPSSLLGVASPKAIQQDSRSLENEGPHEATEMLEGKLNYTSFAQFGQKRYLLQHQASLAQVFQDAPDAQAQIFAALASPHRIIILRTLCQRSCSSQQLQEVLGMGSSGQIYHHLKELQVAGLISERSPYTIKTQAVMPICMAFMIASQLAFPEQREIKDQATLNQE